MRTSLLGSLLASVLLLAVSALRLTLVQAPQESAMPSPIAALSSTLGQWSGRDVSSLGVKTREVLKLDSYVRRFYQSAEDGNAFLYVGYWGKQSGDTQAAKHSPSLCLPANGWRIERLPPLTVSGEVTVTVSRVIGERGSHRVLFLYFFFSGERYLHEEWHSLLYTTWSAFHGGRTDGGIVEVSTAIPPGEDGELRAEATLRAFLDELLPTLHSLIHPTPSLSLSPS